MPSRDPTVLVPVADALRRRHADHIGEREPLPWGQITQANRGKWLDLAAVATEEVLTSCLMFLTGERYVPETHLNQPEGDPA